jgi:hypothetical protein
MFHPQSNRSSEAKRRPCPRDGSDDGSYAPNRSIAVASKPGPPIIQVARLTICRPSQGLASARLCPFSSVMGQREQAVLGGAKGGLARPAWISVVFKRPWMAGMVPIQAVPVRPEAVGGRRNGADLG